MPDELRGAVIEAFVALRAGHEPSDGGTVVNVEGGDPIKTDVVVVSVGRKPATADLGLGLVRIQADQAHLEDVFLAAGESRV